MKMEEFEKYKEFEIVQKTDEIRNYINANCNNPQKMKKLSMNDQCKLHELLYKLRDSILQE